MSQARLLHEPCDQLDVHVLEPRAASLVEDPDEVHRHIGAGEQLAEHARLVHVGHDELHGRQHREVLTVGELASGYPHPVAGGRKLRDELRADEARAAEHADIESWLAELHGSRPKPQCTGTSTMVLPRRTSSTRVDMPCARSRSCCTLSMLAWLTPTIRSLLLSPPWAAGLPGSTS